MNSVHMIGRLTKDVEVQQLDNDKGTFISRFTIAINRVNAKENQQQADFINCVAFNKTALNLSQHCKKGSKIAVEGKVQSFQYEKNEETRFGMNIVANRVEFLDNPINFKQEQDQGEKKEQTENDDPAF